CQGDNESRYESVILEKPTPPGENSLSEVAVNKGIFAAAAVGMALLLSAQVVIAQEQEDRTLLDMNTMRAIINEASGERAMHHIMEFVPYVRVRPIEEYKTNFRETLAMVNFAKQY